MSETVITDNAEFQHKSSGASLGGSVAKLVSSKVASQVIAFATAPVIARLYSPESFGVLQIFASMAGVVGIVSCLRYELSIPMAKSDEEASASLTLSLLLAFAFALVVLVIISVTRGRIVQWFKSPELNFFIWLLPVAIFLSGAISSFRYCIARVERFGGIAWSDFSQSVMNVLVKMVYAIAISSSVAGLFAGYFAGAAFSALLLFAFVWRKPIGIARNVTFSSGILWTAAKLHKKFPIFDSWSALINTLSRQLPPIMLGLYFSTTVAGYYSLGNRLIALPMSLLGSSIAQVFFPVAAKKYSRTEDLSGIVNNVFRKLVQIGVFPIAVLGLLGAPLFGFIFGEQWTEAGIYTQILASFVLFQFVSSPMSTVFLILGSQGKLLVLNIGILSVRTLAIVLGAAIGGPLMVLTAYTVVSVIAYSYMLYWVLHNSSVSLLWGIKVLFKHAGLSCLMLLPIMYVARYLGSMIIVFSGIGFACIVYTYVLYRFDSSIHSFAFTAYSRLRRIKNLV